MLIGNPFYKWDQYVKSGLQRLGVFPQPLDDERRLLRHDSSGLNNCNDNKYDNTDCNNGTDVIHFIPPLFFQHSK